jgi:hypothetical protein
MADRERELAKIKTMTREVICACCGTYRVRGSAAEELAWMVEHAEVCADARFVLLEQPAYTMDYVNGAQPPQRTSQQLAYYYMARAAILAAFEECKVGGWSVPNVAARDSIAHMVAARVSTEYEPALPSRGAPCGDQT